MKPIAFSRPIRFFLPGLAAALAGLLASCVSLDQYQADMAQQRSHTDNQLSELRQEIGALRKTNQTLIAERDAALRAALTALEDKMTAFTAAYDEATRKQLDVNLAASEEHRAAVLALRRQTEATVTALAALSAAAQADREAVARNRAESDSQNVVNEFRTLRTDWDALAGRIASDARDARNAADQAVSRVDQSLLAARQSRSAATQSQEAASLSRDEAQLAAMSARAAQEEARKVREWIEWLKELDHRLDAMDDRIDGAADEAWVQKNFVQLKAYNEFWRAVKTTFDSMGNRLSALEAN